MTNVEVLRVFARGSEGGNHLGVVADTTGIDEAAMQVIATRLGFSETIFIEGDRVRIFTPVTEMPFAGHPIVGAAWALGGGANGASGTFTIEVGEVAYTIAEGVPWVTMRQPGVVTEELDNKAGPMGLPTPLASWVVRLPLPYLVLEYPSPDDVASAEPDLAAVAAMGAQVYIIAPGDGHVRARFFAPGLGVPEDPGTGSAAAALAAVRVAQGVPEGDHLVHQGEEIGWPCAINVRWSSDTVSLGGTIIEAAPTRL